MAIGYNESQRGSTQNDLQLLQEVKDLLIREFKINSADSTRIARDYVNQVAKGLGVNKVDKQKLSAFLRLNEGIDL